MAEADPVPGGVGYILLGDVSHPFEGSFDTSGTLLGASGEDSWLELAGRG
jgi:hypothetical protein